MIREPAVAGVFYPGDSSTLRRQITSFLTVSGRSSDENTTGIVSPHAGYIYSGAVAGAAFASAPDEIDNVIVIAPPHRYPLREASVFDGEGYLTPLGEAPIQRDITSSLLKAGLVFQPGAHMGEHSAEVQVPFIQVRWPASSIVVILQGSSSAEYSQRLAEILSAVTEGIDRILLVASSDLSHYHQLTEAEKMDRKIIDAFLTGYPRNLDIALHEGGEACGRGPMLTLMNYARIMEQTRFEEIMYETSAATSGDRNSVVGYFAGMCGREVRQ